MRRIIVQSTIVLIAFALTGCALARADFPPPPGANAPAPARASESARTTMPGLPDASIEVELGMEHGRNIVDIRYRLRNTSQTTALAVFDRGDGHSVFLGQTPGSIGAPLQLVRDGDIDLVHQTLPFPDPSPTSPPTPLALRVEPGAVVSGEFKVALFANRPTRLRWCLGVMPFDERYFFSPLQTEFGEIWTGPYASAEIPQTVACTPWYDVATAAFERRP